MGPTVCVEDRAGDCLVDSTLKRNGYREEGAQLLSLLLFFVSDCGLPIPLTISDSELFRDHIGNRLFGWLKRAFRTA